MNIETIYQLDPGPTVQRLLCTPTLDLVMEALSKAGEGWFLVVLMIAVAAKGHPDRRVAVRCVIRGLVVLAATGVLVLTAKELVRAPRPLQLLGPARVHVLLEPLRRLSFPSGHSAGVAALAIWASREPSAWARRWPWIFAFLCGLSRVYVGAHWVTDVVGGWLLGAATAAAVCRAWPRPWVTAVPAHAGPAAVAHRPGEIEERP